MKHLHEYTNTQIDEGYISDLLSFFSTLFGIDRWMYSHNTGLFSRNRFGNNPYYNFADPRKRARMAREKARKEKLREKERAKREAAKNRDKKGVLGGKEKVNTANQILNAIDRNSYCKLYSPVPRTEFVTFDWITKHSKDEKIQFVPSAWFEKNVKNFKKNDEFIAIQGTQSDSPYYTVLDCVFRGNTTILPWEDDDVKDTDLEEDVINTELIIPASYFANNDISGFKSYVKSLQKGNQQEEK